MATMPLLGITGSRVTDFRPPSSLSVASSSLSMLKDGVQLRRLLASGAGSKAKQTLQMIIVVLIPIIALMALVAITLIDSLGTEKLASNAKNQLNNFLAVRLSFL